ncbi:MAG TPA: hypothetical protein VGR57_04560 [Ktedonobacterales bacterium]|nr:hypothetical protein [Ktedonobacterales bacterium]
MQGIVAVATDFLQLRRQFFDTPLGAGQDTNNSQALVSLGQMQALARVLGVDLDIMNAPDARDTTAPVTEPTITPLEEYEVVLLTIPANDLPGYETPEWSAFLHRQHIVPLLKALLTLLQQERSTRHTNHQQHAPKAPRRPENTSADDDGPYGGDAA